MTEPMTLEQALSLGYRAGFISACNWPEPVSQDVDSPAFASELRRFIEQHTPAFAKTAQAVDVWAIREVIAEIHGSPLAPGIREARDWADKLTRAITSEKAGRVDGWQPIETAPKDGSPVLIGAQGHDTERARWGWASPWIHGWWVDGDRSDAIGPDFTPTHWMPLPASPAPDKEGQP